MRFSIAGQLLALLLAAVVPPIALAVWWAPRTDAPWLVLSVCILGALVLGTVLVRWWLGPVLSLFRALTGTVSSFRDNDFSFGLRFDRADELAELVDSHNELADALRAQRQALTQRELLLDTMLQHTPVAMVLVAEIKLGDTVRHPIVFANLVARRLLHQGHKLEGLMLDELLERAEPAFREAMDKGGNGLFTVGSEEAEDIYHLARKRFALNSRPHELLLIRQLTQELRRQEVSVWKRVIRVISHELNNSLAPIASLCHSGAELLRRQQTERLPEVFQAIGQRAQHLDQFIRGYAAFAKLPNPIRVLVPWAEFVEGLRTQVSFIGPAAMPKSPGVFDATQLEQALINLLKNAREAGGDTAAVQMELIELADGVRIDVLDRGPGMSETVMAQALMPFYSTKRGGTGLGLALAREIIEAHGGRISLANREGGGLIVSLILPS
ncbi:MAG: ATP-binding protein [Ahniella sp.]|nr:ATP-binding protein [Ahniella sp.]